jgi:hypothetical protein
MDSAMKKQNENSEILVRKFFEDNITVGLLLPDGWFGGRPMENQHRLTFVAARPRRLIVELDDRLLLSFSGESFIVEKKTSNLALESGTPSLEFRGYQQCIFEYLEYGTDSPHEKCYKAGLICMVSSISLSSRKV